MELFQYLDSLRLTLYEKEIIVYLSSVDLATANLICKNAKIPQGRIYSVLNDLQKKGFVFTIPGKPKRYRIKDIKESLEFYLEKKKSELGEKVEQIKSIELKPKSYNIQENEPSVKILGGREEHLNEVIRFRDSAKKELLQTAPSFIGTFATKLSLRKMLEKNIKTKIIIFEINSKNKSNIETGLKYGAEIRVNKSISGFSIMIKDFDEAMFSAHKYENKEERTVICSRNKGLISALENTFLNLWNEAKPVTLKDLKKINK